MIEPTEIMSHVTQTNVIRIISVLLLFWLGLRGLQWFLPWLTEQMPSRFRLYVLPLLPILQLALVVIALMRIVPLVVDPTPENNIGMDDTTITIPTAVELLSFEVEEIDGRSVTLSWETAAEIDNFGFRLYRHNSQDFTAARQIHFEPSTVTSGPGTTYDHTDTVPIEDNYWYWLEDVDTSGATAVHGPVFARVSRFKWQFLPLVGIR